MAKPRFLPKMPVLVQDILASLRWQRMTAEQRGAYMQLLFLQWQEGGLPDDDEALLELGKLAGSPEKHRLLLDAFERGDDGLRRNSKNHRIRLEAEAYCDSQAARARLGGRAKAEQTSASGMPNGTAAGKPPAEPGSSPGAAGSAPPTPTPTPTPNSDSDSASLRSAGAGKPRRPRKPRREANGPHPEAIRTWDELWLESRVAPFVWNAKEATAIAECLKLAGGDLELFRARASRLLNEPPDAWYAQNASPTILASRWNPLAVRVNKRPRTQTEVNNELGAQMAEWAKNPT